MSNEQKDSNKTQESKRGHKRDVVARVRFLYFAFVVVGLIIVVRLIGVQIASPTVKHNANVLKEGVYRNDIVEAHRGAILTRDGEPLAISSLRSNVEIDFKAEGIRDADSLVYIKYADSLARLLAAHFTEADAAEHGYKYISAKDYFKILCEERTRGKHRSYRLFPRLVTIDEWDVMRKYPILNHNLGYVYFKRDEEYRIYPMDDVARQTIGRHTPITIENEKEKKQINGTGIEYFYNSDLKGVDGQMKEQWIAHGFWSRVDDPDNRLPEDGCDVITTLDAGIQRAADSYLRDALQRENASFGVAIVMEVETGNILAMVSLGSGKERGNIYTERIANHALSSSMMPGSTMKLATTMALLEIGGYDLDTKVNTEHSDSKKFVKVGNANVYDTHDAAGKGTDGNITLLQAFEHSSNVYYAKAVYERWKNNPSEYTKFLAKLRFNDYIGMERYGEARPHLPMAGTAEWNVNGSTSTRLPRLAYGYELTVPPIHMITFYNGIANEGRMVAPRIVDRIERNGEVIESLPTVTLIERMCSKRTLKLLDSCLVAGTWRTSGKFKDLPISFGCKTGTAQMWSNFVSIGEQDYKQMLNGIDKDDGYYYGSIICVMPAEKPKYTILVGICKQRMYNGDPYYGILLAGPVANNIMTYIHANDHTLHAEVERAEKPYGPTRIKAGASEDVAEVSRRLCTKHTSSDKGKKWSKANVDENGKSTVTGLEFAQGTVPDVRGMGLSDALYLLESAGMTVTHSGYGSVRTQSVYPGKKITSDNRKIHLTLR